jgi:hypothetical protein
MGRRTKSVTSDAAPRTIYEMNTVYPDDSKKEVFCSSIDFKTPITVALKDHPIRNVYCGTTTRSARQFRSLTLHLADENLTDTSNEFKSIYDRCQKLIAVHYPKNNLHSPFYTPEDCACATSIQFSLKNPDTLVENPPPGSLVTGNISATGIYSKAGESYIQWQLNDLTAVAPVPRPTVTEEFEM